MRAATAVMDHVVLSTAYENIEITTRSHPDAFPSALQQKRKTQTKTHNADEVRLKVGEEWEESDPYMLTTLSLSSS